MRPRRGTRGGSVGRIEQLLERHVAIDAAGDAFGGELVAVGAARRRVTRAVARQNLARPRRRCESRRRDRCAAAASACVRPPMPPRT